jgi:ATP-dependent Clp protease protease subunit
MRASSFRSAGSNDNEEVVEELDEEEKEGLVEGEEEPVDPFGEFQIEDSSAHSKEECVLKLLSQRIIFLDNYLSQAMGSFICANLMRMDNESSEEPITIIINSCGGNVTSALFPIIDTMMMTEAPIATVAVGEAYSSAAVILAAGTPGMRSASPLSKIMIHGIAVDAIGGKENDIKLEAKILKEMNIQLMELLARFCGQSLTKVKRNCSKDYYLSPKDAVQYGLIDSVLPYKKEIRPLKK